VSQRTSVGTRRSAPFLNWRYASHPVFTYRLVDVRRKARLEGIAVYRLEPVTVDGRSLQIARITELFGSAAAVAAAVGHIVAAARADGAAALDFFCAADAPHRTLAAAGFMPVDDPIAQAFPIVFQPIDRARTAVSLMVHQRSASGASRAWYVTKGDGDQDRPN
jgi:hypothetical protein